MALAVSSGVSCGNASRGTVRRPASGRARGLRQRVERRGRPGREPGAPLPRGDPSTFAVVVEGDQPAPHLGARLRPDIGEHHELVERVGAQHAVAVRGAVQAEQDPRPRAPQERGDLLQAPIEPQIDGEGASGSEPRREGLDRGVLAHPPQAVLLSRPEREQMRHEVVQHREGVLLPPIDRTEVQDLAHHRQPRPGRQGARAHPLGEPVQQRRQPQILLPGDVGALAPPERAEQDQLRPLPPGHRGPAPPR